MHIRKYFKLYDTYGWIAIASLLVCTLTGVFLVVPFNPANAYASVTAFVTSNPAASLTRNLHYWSAQMFLVFTLFHFIDHYLKVGKGKPVKPGMWLRLVLSLLVVFYVMLSGFILKDDADSRQASLILSAMVSSLPLIGETLGLFIAGSENNLIVMYLHHAATGTIIIFMVIYEHVRTIKVKMRTLLITTSALLITSLLFRAPLGSLDEVVMKGPWYFIGVQELLHLLTYPLVVIGIITLLLAMVYATPLMKSVGMRAVKITVLILVVLYGLLSFSGYFLRGQSYKMQMPWQEAYILPSTLDFNLFSAALDDGGALVQVNGGTEGCMTCHGEMKGLSKSHDPAVMGCYSCHGGDPFSLDKNAAHRRMMKVPGNLNNSAEACGGSGCHDDIVERVPKSMMATLTGMIAVDKWVFGESKTPNGHYNVMDLGNSPSDVHLKNLCAGCHIGMEKTSTGTQEWLERGGGCLACHLTYNDQSLATLAEVKGATTTSNKKPGFHPSIDINITNDKCLSCHSRSGRVSMSYEGWSETNLKDIPSTGDKSMFNKLPDGRVFQKMPADVHHEAGMLCIDCHGSRELMGDGKGHQHKEEAVKVQCENCHIATKANLARLSATDRETQLVAWLRDWSQGDPEVVVTSNSSHPLVNTRSTGNLLTLLGKIDNKTRVMKPAAASCVNDKSHGRLTCEACHTAWVPQCIGCHNTYEADAKGYDMTTRSNVKGAWVEYTGDFMAEYPTLGIENSDKQPAGQKVGIFAPGMVMTIDNGHFDKGQKNIFHRLYAPMSGHTTRRESRSCVSCHNDPLALGYGRGKLTLLASGDWKFDPLYQDNPNDNLPEDAWTGFMKERNDLSATRSNMRPFNIKEQKALLAVGACLTCHDEGTKVMNSCLVDFEGTVRKITSKCVVSNY